MKFKLVEKFDETRSIVQEYMYDAMDELNNASLEEYIQWFKDNLTSYPEDIEQAVTDAYIEACDYGMIKGVEKTRLTSELKEYIESHTDIIDDTDELMRQCPSHLQHELTLVLDKIDDSLNESLFDDTHYWNSPYDHAVFKYINENPDLVDDIETLYQRCSKYLKPSLVKILDHAEVVDSLSVKRAKYLLQTYDPLVLINVIRDKDDTFRGNNAFDALEYGVNHWEDLFSDITLNESLTESTLEESIRPDLKTFIEQHAELLDENNIEELYKQCPRELKIPLVRLLNAASLSDNIESIKRATYLADFYDDDELINLVLSVGEHANDVFDAFDYIMNNWDEFFTDDILTEELLTEGGPRGQEDLRKFICELLNTVCKTVLNPQDFMIHHKDGDHDNNHPKNIVLLPVGTRAVRTTGAVATNKRGKTLTNPNSSIHRYISNSSHGVIKTSDHKEYLNIINNYSGIDVWRSLQKHTLVYLDDKLLKRDLNRSLKNPTGRIK